MRTILRSREPALSERSESKGTWRLHKRHSHHCHLERSERTRAQVRSRSRKTPRLLAQATGVVRRSRHQRQGCGRKLTLAPHLKDVTHITEIALLRVYTCRDSCPWLGLQGPRSNPLRRHHHDQQFFMATGSQDS